MKYALVYRSLKPKTHSRYKDTIVGYRYYTKSSQVYDISISLAKDLGIHTPNPNATGKPVPKIYVKCINHTYVSQTELFRYTKPITITSTEDPRLLSELGILSVDYTRTDFGVELLNIIEHILTVNKICYSCYFIEGDTKIPTGTRTMAEAYKMGCTSHAIHKHNRYSLMLELDKEQCQSGNMKPLKIQLALYKNNGTQVTPLNYKPVFEYLNRYGLTNIQEIAFRKVHKEQYKYTTKRETDVQGRKDT